MVATVLCIGGQTIAVERKAIAQAHLSVYPPNGNVRLAVPIHVSDEAVRAFAIRKLGWIRLQQAKLQAQEREPVPELINRESHWLWGQRRLLRVIERDEPQRVEVTPQRLELFVRPGTDSEGRAEILSAWHREQVRQRALPMLALWQVRLGVQAKRLYVQHMRTHWGTCTISTASVRLNTELARKPPACLEYILVHELLHLLEPTHNSRFLALLDRHLPGWTSRRDLLNRLPVRHEHWTY